MCNEKPQFMLFLFLTFEVDGPEEEGQVIERRQNKHMKRMADLIFYCHVAGI